MANKTELLAALLSFDTVRPRDVNVNHRSTVSHHQEDVLRCLERRLNCLRCAKVGTVRKCIETMNPGDVDSDVIILNRLLSGIHHSLDDSMTLETMLAKESRLAEFVVGQRKALSEQILSDRAQIERAQLAIKSVTDQMQALLPELEYCNRSKVVVQQLIHQAQSIHSEGRRPAGIVPFHVTSSFERCNRIFRDMIAFSQANCDTDAASERHRVISAINPQISTLTATCDRVRQSRQVPHEYTRKLTEQATRIKDMIHSAYKSRFRLDSSKVDAAIEAIAQTSSESPEADPADDEKVSDHVVQLFAYFYMRNALRRIDMSNNKFQYETENSDTHKTLVAQALMETKKVVNFAGDRAPSTKHVRDAEFTLAEALADVVSQLTEKAAAVDKKTESLTAQVEDIARKLLPYQSLLVRSTLQQAAIRSSGDMRCLEGRPVVDYVSLAVVTLARI